MRCSTLGSLGGALVAASAARTLALVSSAANIARERNNFFMFGFKLFELQWQLDRGFAFLFGADANGFIDVGNKDFSIANLSGLGRADDGLDGGIDATVREHQFKFDLGQEIDRVFAAAID